jgi:hypothetical protein
MYPREEFITAGVRETAQGGEYPIVKSNSFPGIFKNMPLCFVFGIKTYFQKRRVQLCLFILTPLWANITYKRGSLYFKRNLPSKPYIGKNIDFLDQLI